MTLTNKLNLPQGIVNACALERHNKAGCLSATTLLKGIREIIFTERYWDKISFDVAENIWALFGTATHKLLEHEGADDVTEVDVSKEVNGITITGRIDSYDMKKGIITDWKTTSVWKVTHNDFADWKAQGLLYAWLLGHNGFPAHKIRFVALLKDWKQSDARRKSEYPQAAVYVYEFEPDQRDLSELELFIKDKVTRYKKYIKQKDADIPPCTPAERWEGAKGEPVKCRDFCVCRAYCGFYAGYKEARNV